MNIYLQLFLTALFPAVISAVFYLLIKKTHFGKLPEIAIQIIIGIIFGGIAVLGTEFGIDVGGATANARDAAPLCAGLLFGGPAGIIAGFIGGIERWFASAWGAGVYSRLACTISTCLAGLYSAFLRRVLFENKRPTWGVGFATGVVMEVIHLTILLLTHLDDTAYAFTILKICTLPMILCNAAAVALAVILIQILSHSLRHGEHHTPKISQRVQRRLLAAVAAAYFITTLFVYVLQSGIALKQAETLTSLNLHELTTELQDSAGTIPANATENRHVGETGYSLIADRSGKLISGKAGESCTDLRETGIVLDSGSAEEMDLQNGSVYGEECFWMFTRVGEYFVISVLPEAEAYSGRDVGLFVNSFMEVLVFAALFLLIYLLIKHQVVDNIHSVNNSLGKITDGDLSVTVDVRKSDEFSDLSDGINSTVTSLKQYIAEADARIDEELEFAKKIQLATLPSTFPAFPGRKELDIYATTATAKEVGGDFYDFYILGENWLCFLIADVSGKGIPAAMFMMTAKTIIQSLSETGIMVQDVLAKANEKLCEENDAGMFVTVWMGVMDLRNGHVTYANAGHNPPLLLSDNGEYRFLKSKPGFVLAGMEGVKYRLEQFDMKPGDKLFLYTDGVTEATNISQELYGENRLSAFLNGHKDASPEETLKAVREDLDCFVGEADQFDDITMLMLEYKGIQNLMKERIFVASDEALSDVTSFVDEELEKAECSPKTVMQIDVALEEVFINVAHYAYPGMTGTVKVAVGVWDDEIHIRLNDSGIPFNPLERKDPDITASAEERGIGGLGIFMVKKFMDTVWYEYKNGQNVLTLTKKLT